MICILHGGTWPLVGVLATEPTAAPLSIPACGSAAFPWSSPGCGGFSPPYGNALRLWGTWGWVGNGDFYVLCKLAYFPHWLLLQTREEECNLETFCKQNYSEIYRFSLGSGNEIRILPQNVYIFWPKQCLFCWETSISLTRVVIMRNRLKCNYSC